jgi:ribulose-5-phosphate 4-epimerase/fuculose-1-phosphate aldolase
VNAVVHFHAAAVVPFGVLGPDVAPYKAIYLMASFLSSSPAPIFDIADSFGHGADILITSVAKGDALAAKLNEPGGIAGIEGGKRTVVLMRGHGAMLVAGDLMTATFRAVYAVNNAEILYQALQFGGPKAITFLSAGECFNATVSIGGQVDRPWNLWSSQIQL